MEAILSAVLGFAVIAGAIWVVAALLKRVTRLEPSMALLISILCVPAFICLGFLFWVCGLAGLCGS